MVECSGHRSGLSNVPIWSSELEYPQDSDAISDLTSNCQLQDMREDNLKHVY